MQIGDRVLAADQPVYVIAEIGVNHDGCCDRALDLVEVAADAGADAVKLQYFETEHLLSSKAVAAAYQKRSGNHDPIAMLRALELSLDDMPAIIEHAHQRNLHAIVTLFSIETVAPATALPWDALKTASPDIINRPLIRALVDTGRPLLLSTGGATEAEVKSAIQWLGDTPHVLMQCVSAYPTPVEQAALGGIRGLQRIDPAAIGYSDHTTAIETGGLAVAAGARVLEKHITLDRSTPGPDHAASLEPDDLSAYINFAHKAAAMLGAACGKQLQPIEGDVRSVSRQSLTTTRSLSSGHTLSRDDLTVKRPGSGISPALLDEIIGRRLCRDIVADTPLREDDLS